MDANISPIERAFQLAATGRYATIAEVRLQLVREGCSQSELEGPVLRRQVMDIIIKARNAKDGTAQPT
jgi:hypothetical protein